MEHMEETQEIDWDRVIETSRRASNFLLESSQNSFVKIVVNGKSVDDLMNDLIVCSLSESPESSRKMFSKGSGESDNHLYLRMIHDFTKKCNKQKNELIYKNPLKNTEQVLYKLFESGAGSEYWKRTANFQRTLLGRDKDIFDSLMLMKYVNSRKLAKKYGVTEETITRAKNRLIRRYKDYMGLIEYYRVEHLEDLTEGIIRKEMRSYE